MALSVAGHRGPSVCTRLEVKASLGGHVSYLHSNAEVHHGDTGAAMPAHVHHCVATVRGLALQRGPRGAQVIL